MSSTRPLVTVVTTTYHWPGVLRIAMASALAQTFRDFEYLVIGDACTDETESVVASFGDPRVRWHNLPQNCGNQSGPNRLAVEMARGKYVAYLNHDDIWFPNHLEALVQGVAANDLDLLHSLCLEIAPPGHSYRGVLGLPYPHPAGAEHGLTAHIMTSSIMHLREAALAAGNWRDWQQLQELPTVDFLRRLRQLRGRRGTLHAVTVLKFHSADRRDSYRLKAADEQAKYWQLICQDRDFLTRELLAVVACQQLGMKPPKLAEEPRPATPPPGWQINQWRRMRGLDPMPPASPGDPAR